MKTVFKAIRFGAYTTIAATLLLSFGAQAFAKGPAGSKNDTAALTGDNSKKILA